MESKKCINCDKELNRIGKKYCNATCQNENQRDIKIKLWLEGGHDGMRGNKGTSRFIKHYLVTTRGEKCEKCGWCERNEYSGKIPIELEHKDGDFRNNDINNLELLCPNCHSLTKTYKSLNIGNGRPR